MIRKTGKIAMLVLVLCAATVAAAQQPSQNLAPAKAPAPQSSADAANTARIAAARTLVQTMRTEQQMRAQQANAATDAETGFDRMIPAQIAMRAQLTDAQGYARARQEAIRLMVDDRQRTADETIPMMVDAEVRRFAAHYSVEELRGLDAFYRSPLGQRVIAEQPKIAADSVQFQQSVLAPIVAAHNAAIVPKLGTVMAPVFRQAGAVASPTPAPTGKKP